MSYKREKIPGLELNLITGLYQIRENGITYNFEFDMIGSLKDYVENDRRDKFGIIAAWYKTLNEIQRHKVIITGELENQ